jgi:CDP-glycerol glycerophosphotransferase
MNVIVLEDNMATLTLKEKIRKEFRRLIRTPKLLLRITNNFIKMDPQCVVFISTPDFADNSKALWEYINSKTQLKTVWLVHDLNLLRQMRESGITTYLDHSFQGKMAFFRSRYIVCTHGQFTKTKNKRQVLINLWHGNPIKGMFNLDQSFKKPSRVKSVFKNSNYVVVSSDIMRFIFASCFHMDIRKIVVKGQPRCDKLLSTNGKKILSMVLGEDLEQYHKIILYAPTFRKKEGKDIESNLFRLDDYNSDSINTFLKKENSLLIAKLHPFEEAYYRKKNFAIPANCRIIYSEDLSRKLVDLYDILNAFDILITDYSSVYFDYLLLDRPIIFLQSDLELYQTRRGFVFENYEFWMPGEKVKHMNTFMAALEKSIENDGYQNQRQLVNKLVNAHWENVCADIVDSLIIPRDTQS